MLTMTRQKTTRKFRMPYGCIALGGGFAMAASFFVPRNGVLMFAIGLLVIVLSFAFALCRALAKPGGLWWF